MSLQVSTAQDTGLGGFGHSSADDADVAGREAVRGALGGRAPAAGDLVVIFPAATYDLEALHRAALEEAGPAAVVGATTCGAFTDDAQVGHGCVAAHLPGDEVSFGVCHVERDDADIAGATRRAAEVARDRAGVELAHAVLMLMCDGLTPDQRAMARGAFEVTTSIIPLVGGAAGDDLRWQATHTFGEGRILPNGILTVWINAPRPVAVSVDHGWRPYGKPMLVTRAEGTTICELDGRPALEVYLAECGGALKEDARSFGERCSGRPLGLPNAHGRYDLRHVHERAPGGGIVLTTAVPEHTVVQDMPGDAESLLRGARRAAAAAAEQLDGPARLALVFSCCTRAPLLGDRLPDEVELVSSALGGAAAGGFYTCGEFARVTGSTGIHNASVAILAF